MSTFHYRGLTDDGSVVEGDLRAQVRQEAYRAMEFHGLRPIRLEEFPDATMADVAVPEKADV